MLFNLALEYAIRNIQVNNKGLKLNGTHKHLVDADEVNILGGRILYTYTQNVRARTRTHTHTHTQKL